MQRTIRTTKENAAWYRSRFSEKFALITLAWHLVTWSNLTSLKLKLRNWNYVYVYNTRLQVFFYTPPFCFKISCVCVCVCHGMQFHCCTFAWLLHFNSMATVHTLCTTLYMQWIFNSEGLSVRLHATWYWDFCRFAKWFVVCGLWGVAVYTQQNMFKEIQQQELFQGLW